MVAANAMQVVIRRLKATDRATARALFALLTHVFGERAHALSDVYLDGLLARADFWAMAAFADGRLVGGLTAHTLPMTREEGAEVFIYDIALGGVPASVTIFTFDTTSKCTGSS